MADVTGGTPPTGASEFNPPQHLKDVYDHFGDPRMFSVASASALPASGNWNGRILVARDTDNVYMWRGSWKIIWLPRTDWTTLTPAAGWTAGTGVNAPQVMRDGYTTWFRGAFFGGTANTTCTTLPSWATPSRTNRVVLTSDTNAFGFVRIFNGGAMQPSVTAIHAENLISWMTL